MLRILCFDATSRNTKYKSSLMGGPEGNFLAEESFSPHPAFLLKEDRFSLGTRDAVPGPKNVPHFILRFVFFLRKKKGFPKETKRSSFVA